MAHDVVKYDKTLYLNQEFADGDTRTISIPAPISNLTLQDLRELESYMVTNQPTIGDKTGAAFTKFKSAYTSENNKIILDPESLK